MSHADCLVTSTVILPMLFLVGRVSLESLSLEFSESNGSVAVCAMINGLPAGGLGTDVDLSFGIVSASAGIHNTIIFYVYICLFSPSSS